MHDALNDSDPQDKKGPWGADSGMMGQDECTFNGNGIQRERFLN